LRTKIEDGFCLADRFFDNPKDIKHGQVWKYYRSTRTVIVDSVDNSGTVSYIYLADGQLSIDYENFQNFQYLYDLVIDEIKE